MRGCEKRGKFKILDGEVIYFGIGCLVGRVVGEMGSDKKEVKYIG